MAKKSTDKEAKPETTTAAASGAVGNTAVPARGDHDRVALLSLKPDGTPDQHDPELIGDREFALAATKEQFRQQAVSAVDAAERPTTAAGVTLVGEPDGGVREEPARSDPDPATAELKAKHDDAAKAADSAAEATVNALLPGGKGS